MAASEPAPNVHRWTNEMQSSNQGVDTKSIEMGMSGMTLVSSYNSKGLERKEAEQTIVSSSPRDVDGPFMDAHSSFSQVPPPPNTAPSVSTSILDNSHHETSSLSAPLSPGSDKHHSGVAKGVSRPPGITVGPLPSPIGKPGHSKNTSATSPLLTLTPNSSVDGNSDWHSMGARMSPQFQTTDVPALPFLHNGDQHRGNHHVDDGVASLGSFDLGQDNDNDGLLGLEALRDRAQSSPGPVRIVSGSPPVTSMRGHFAAHSSASSTASAGSSHHDGYMERQRPRERPPLSYSYQEGSSNHQGDRNVGGPVFLPARSNSAGPTDANNISFDSSDSRFGFGAIGRPELRETASDYDMSRRRASSQGDYQYIMQQHQMQQQAGGFPDPMQKFGSLPSLGSHVQQQRMPDNLAELQRPRHVRSVSTPMAPFTSQQLPLGIDPRYQAAIQLEGHSYSGENKYRSAMSQPQLSSSFDANHYSTQKRVSMPNIGGTHGYGQAGYSNPARRDGMDYHQRAVIASTDDIRGYPNPSMISPGHSPMQTHYSSGHSRHSTEGSAMLSSSPRSVGGMSRVSMGSMVQGVFGGDEDLTHPLVGEHIDVPEHDDMYLPSYGLSQSLPGSMQSRNHGHSMSMDQMLPQFIETPHHLPTAGAALPMPKVVYSVKFKRTQRNFVLGPRINRDLKIGTYVKVEADRGEDLGIVVGKLPSEKYSFSGRSGFSSVNLGATAGMGGGDLKRIIRLATHDEVSLLSMKRDEEEELLKICRSKVRQRGLPMNVVDAEYQFDRHKLTFFFEAEGRVDFRELVRDLFSMYKTRIWMQQLDKNTSTSAPAMINPHPSTLQIDYGTPIIAPVSEFADSIILGGLSTGDARSH